jgi:hypothetical protein
MWSLTTLGALGQAQRTTLRRNNSIPNRARSIIESASRQPPLGR